MYLCSVTLKCVAYCIFKASSNVLNPRALVPWVCSTLLLLPVGTICRVQFDENYTSAQFDENYTSAQFDETICFIKFIVH